MNTALKMLCPFTPISFLSSFLLPLEALFVDLKLALGVQHTESLQTLRNNDKNSVKIIIASPI
jgi:hypothetical protein